MRKSKDSIIRIDGQVLTFAGKVFPLRNIAYFEKFEVKRKTGIGKVFFLTVLVLVAIGVASASSDGDAGAGPFVTGLAFLAAVYLAWIIYLIRRRKRYDLLLQTNAGDSPRLLTSHDEQFLDDLLQAVSSRLATESDLPPLIANINDNSITVEGDVVMRDQIRGDQFNVKGGQIGAIGTGAHAHDINFNNMWNQLIGDIDLRELGPELAKLREEMKDEAVETEHYTALAEIAKAEAAATSGDGAKVLEHLRSAGTWALEAATKISSKLAVEAIEHSMSL